jgi:hypothetical protein
MKKMDPILAKIAVAKKDMLGAEEDLEKVLREMQVVPRAEKTSISKVVEDAFAKLRAARANLVDLETSLKAEAEDE